MPEPLDYEAFLYASDQLDERRRAEFEERLGSDQSARDAVSRTVRILIEPAGAAGPDPAYRDAVRARLGVGPPAFVRAAWRALWGPFTYHGHPLVWGLLGAAVVVLVLRHAEPAPSEETSRSPVVAVTPAAPKPTAEEAVVSEEGRRRQPRQDERTTERSEPSTTPSAVVGVD